MNNNHDPAARRRSLRGLPLVVAAAYGGVATVWILASDAALVRLGVDMDAHASLSVAKGLGFVLVTSLALYALVRRGVAAQLRAFDALAATEQQQRRRLEALPYAYLELDAEGRIRFANPAAASLLRVAEPAECVLGDLLQGLPAHRALAGALRSLAAGETNRGSFRAQVAGSEGAATELRADWVVDADGGNQFGLVVLLADITAWVGAAAENQRLAAVLEATPDLVATTDPSGRITYMNRAGCDMLGRSTGPAADAGTLGDFMPAWAAQLLNERGRAEAMEAGTWTGETALLDGDGREIPVSQVLIAHRDADGRLDYLSTIARDISERKAMDEALYMSREQYRSLVENTHDALVVAQDGLVRYVNPRLCEMLGFAREAYIGGASLEFVHPDDRERVRTWYRAIRHGHERESSVRFRFLRFDGSVCWVEGKASTILWEGHDAVLSFFRDVTEKVEAEGRLEYLAQYDALTGLPNRDLFLARLADAVARARAQGTALGVVYLNLTRFQIFNDSYGHELGDRLIRAVGERLDEHAGESDLVARVGGDEFVVLLDRLSDSDGIPPGVRSLFAAMEEGFRVQGQEFFLSASAGIGVFPDDGDDPQVLLRNAASALEAAKQSGAGTYQYYAAGLNEQARRRVALETDLRRALQRGEFEVNFQPQVDLRDGRVKGAEALLRWNHGARGRIMPGDFIPLLEESDLILDVGAWVLRRACEFQCRWRREAGRDLRVSVNLSARQLDDRELVGRVRGILEETGADPQGIELEITESSLVHDPATAARTLEALKGLGIGLAVDDFGTGYSSLSYFRRFPIDTLKIDKAFVGEAVIDPGTAEIVKAIIAMGHSLGCHLVAEGVETAGQLRFLQEQGCDWMQGFYLSAPVAADALEAMLAEEGGALIPLPDEDSGAPSVLVIGGDDDLLAEVRDALLPAALEVREAASADAALEALAQRPAALVLVDSRLSDMDAPAFAARVQALGRAPRCALIGGVQHVLLAAHVDPGGPVHRFLTRPLASGTLQRLADEAVRARPDPARAAALGRSGP